MKWTDPALPAVWRHPEFVRGARELMGISMAISAWGLVSGVAMAKSGLPTPLAVLMALFVYAGSTQLAVLPLLVGGAPAWVVWATALCVNLRFIIFSAAWRPYFAHLPLRHRFCRGFFTADLNYVVFLHRFPDRQPSPEQGPYFWGGVAVNWLFWQVPQLAGIVLGDRIPTSWGLGFAGTLALLGLLYSLVSNRATLLAALVAGCAAVAANALPLKLNIVVAIAAAVAIGLSIEHAAQRGTKRVELT